MADDHVSAAHAGTATPAEPHGEPPPPLPPRPPISISQWGSLRLSRPPSTPQLLSTPTTALSSTHARTQTHGDDASPHSSPSGTVSRKHSFTHLMSHGLISDGDDSALVKSYVSRAQAEEDGPFESWLPEDHELQEQIQTEFDHVTALCTGAAAEKHLLGSWKAKLKHFFILSASGKPIYSRHGDVHQISHYVGVAQTLISSFQAQEDGVKSFRAGATQFVMLSKAPLNLVATSRLPESEAQLRSQLESLYMQILSTLTLPSMETIFRHRPSTDLRRPLQGTDVLLDGLADGFTRGSPSALLSALECLRLRKTQRRTINDTLLHLRSPNLLYGLVVAAGRLVSVVRPKKHSLHPGDLHLIFNMLFEGGSVRAGGGENWIPLCLPAFNNTGFLYMYVSFFGTHQGATEAVQERQADAAKDDELAFVLISANKEAFFEMRKMRDQLIQQLETNGSMSAIRTAIRKGHAPCSEIVPGTVLRHFLYKSRGNVQFVMPSFEPHFKGAVARRRLLNLYAQLHDSIHSRTAHLKVQHCTANDSTALAWETPSFELYCVAGPNNSRAALAQGADKVVQWIAREEERVFIIGGAVF